MLAVRIGEVSDIVIAKIGNYGVAAAAFQGSRFFSNHFESCVQAFGGQKVGQSFRRVIARRKYVIFSVKPEDYVHGIRPGLLRSRATGGKQANYQQPPWQRCETS